MDALTFATPRQIRNLCAAASAKLPIIEYEYDKVLEGLQLTSDQFVDLCILCGCDYCGSIKSECAPMILASSCIHCSCSSIASLSSVHRYKSSVQATPDVAHDPVLLWRHLHLLVFSVSVLPHEAVGLAMA